MASIRVVLVIVSLTTIDKYENTTIPEIEERREREVFMNTLYYTLVLYLFEYKNNTLYLKCEV